MSHTSTHDGCMISDLTTLEEICKELGVRLVRDQTEFQTYGGARNSCDMAIVDADGKASYQIGLVKARWDEQNKVVVADKDGTGYQLQFDDWNQMGGLANKVGRGCSRLVDRYATEAGARKMISLGWQVRRETLADGTVKLYGTPPARTRGRQSQQASW